MATSTKAKRPLYDEVIAGFSSDEDILPLWQRVGRPGSKQQAVRSVRKTPATKSTRTRAKRSSSESLKPLNNSAKKSKQFPRVLAELSNEDILPDLNVSSSKTVPILTKDDDDDDMHGLTSSDDEKPSICRKDSNNRVTRAEAKKDVGNVFYKQKKYQEAIKCYNEAIELRPNVAAYHTNRSACYMMVHDYTAALKDAQQAIKIDHSFTKGHLREARCYLSMGDFTACKRSLDTAKSVDPKNQFLQSELVMFTKVQDLSVRLEECMEKQHYDEAISIIDKMLLCCTACVPLRIKRAELLSTLLRFSEAQACTDTILEKNPLNPDALYIRGVCLYYQDNLDRAIPHFQSVLQLAPDHQDAVQLYKKAKQFKALKEAGNASFKMGNYQDAYVKYASALQVDPSNHCINAKIYFNQATSSAKLGDHLQAIENASKAVRLDEHYIKAYLRRAKSYFDLAMYEESVMDYEIVYSKLRTAENFRLLEKAKSLMKMCKNQIKDYYKVLGLPRTANPQEIKKGYRRQALVHHPDRHSNSSAEVKLYQEKKFKEVGEAYQTLSDLVRKSAYDFKLAMESHR